jgi:hypothetical protein
MRSGHSPDSSVGAVQMIACRRRAVALVLVAVVIPVLLGVAALTVDVAYLYGVRSDLQNAADAAALAGAGALAGDTMMQVRMGTEGSIGMVEYTGEGHINLVSSLNSSLARQGTVIGSSDVIFGWLDLLSATSAVQNGVPLSQFNAVHVQARRTDDSANGPVTLLFAQIFGQSTTEVTASAVAVYDDRMSAFDTNESPGGVLPFTVHTDLFAADFAGGPDDYEYDPITESTFSGSDGIREIKLYPHDNSPGNFGLLNIGTPNQGTPGLRDHIDNGVPPEDFAAETGSAVLTFFDANGDSITYDITGDPGLKATLESNVAARMGEVVGFFLHNAVSGSGANTVYTINDIRFGRLVYVNLNGNNKAVYLQPVSYTGGGVVLSSVAPSSGGQVGRLVLAR